MNTTVKTEDVPVKSIPFDDRLIRLGDLFNDVFGHRPSFYVRVPGRVNIIGEHIDYCGYPVLPMALEQDILLAVGISDNQELQIRNVNHSYKDCDLTLKTCDDINIIPDSDGKPLWYNYVLCGVKGALEYLENPIVSGLQILVDGNIPPASGLSSSSALVSAACLAFLHANGAILNKSEIASLCAKSERYIGTQGGGMDQAIAFLAEKYSAQYITWTPLKATAVTLPEDASFVVAHSLAEANKAATNDFNRRVIECRLAAKILALATGVISENKIITLSDVQRKSGKSLEEMVKLVHEHLSNPIYTKDDLCKKLNLSNDELEELYLTNNTKDIKEFKLRQRALHVYEEAMRVDKFRDVCLQISNGNNSKTGSGDDVNYKNCEAKQDAINLLGELMSESHESLKNLYECSHSNLDRLVDISKQMNIHARLTGAGWGGCIVALCPKQKVDEYIKKLNECFYSKYSTAEKNHAFATTPNHGAVIYTGQQLNLRKEMVHSGQS